LEVIGSTVSGPQELPPQQDDPAPALTRSAAWPYFSRTVDLMSGVLTRASQQEWLMCL
jgi:hypothetical protein